jgi:hypothetical protein
MSSPSKKGRLPAARRTDEGRDRAAFHHEVNTFEHEVIAEPRARVARLEGRRAHNAVAGEIPPGRNFHHVTHTSSPLFTVVPT